MDATRSPGRWRGTRHRQAREGEVGPAQVVGSAGAICRYRSGSTTGGKSAW